MRLTYRFLLAFFLLSSLLVVAAHAQKQVAFASLSPTAGGSAPAVPASPDLMLLSGKITNPSGPLPGAVVILKGTRQMAVTNAEGQFQFTVPADAGALPAVVTYAGYADEELVLNAAADKSTVNLSNARTIEVARGQRLKVYLKTARKEVKRDLRQVRK